MAASGLLACAPAAAYGPSSLAHEGMAKLSGTRSNIPCRVHQFLGATIGMTGLSCPAMLARCEFGRLEQNRLHRNHPTRSSVILCVRSDLCQLVLATGIRAGGHWSLRPRTTSSWAGEYLCNGSSQDHAPEPPGVRTIPSKFGNHRTSGPNSIIAELPESAKYGALSSPARNRHPLSPPNCGSSR